jgi:hypothetical protein
MLASSDLVSLPSPPQDLTASQLPHDEPNVLSRAPNRVCLVWSPSLLEQSNRLSHILHDRYDLFEYLFQALSFSSLEIVAPKPVPI